MRRVYRQRCQLVSGPSQYQYVDAEELWFHGWAPYADEFRDGNGNYAVGQHTGAVVENAKGKCEIVPMSEIRFKEPPT